MAAVIEKAFLVLAQAVIVLVIGRSKGCAHLIEGSSLGRLSLSMPAVPSLWFGTDIAQPCIRAACFLRAC